MNNKKILTSAVIALASMAAGSAFADSFEQQHPVVASTQSTVTRAQVQNELAQAQKDGTWSATDNYRSYPVINNVGTPKARAEVQAELTQAQQNHSIPVFRR